jgi:hypothetical protein
MQDGLPQGDPPLLDQVLILDPPDPLPFEDVVDQAFVSPQERLQTVRATRLGACKNVHSWRVANRYNYHSDISFQVLE